MRSEAFVLGLTVVVLFGFVWLRACAPVPKEEPSEYEREVKLPLLFQHETTATISPIRTLAYSPKQRLIAYSTGFNNFGQFGKKPILPVYLWDLTTNKLNQTLEEHGQEVDYLAFTPDGDRLLSGASDGMILWDLVKGTKDREQFKALSHSATLMPSGKELFSSDKEANLVIWDVKSGKQKQVLKATDENKNGINSIIDLKRAISADEQFIAFGAGLTNRSIVIWDYKKGEVAASLHYDAIMHYLCFSKPNRYLFAGGDEVTDKFPGRSVLEIWDTGTWKRLHRIMIDKHKVIPILYIPKDDILLTVDLVRPPEEGYLSRFKTLINGYSVKTGEQVLSYDTELGIKESCHSAIYIEDLNAICIGGNRGKISFYSVAEVLKHKKK